MSETKPEVGVSQVSRNKESTRQEDRKGSELTGGKGMNSGNRE